MIESFSLGGLIVCLFARVRAWQCRGAGQPEPLIFSIGPLAHPPLPPPRLPPPPRSPTPRPCRTTPYLCGGIARARLLRTHMYPAPSLLTPLPTPHPPPRSPTPPPLPAPHPPPHFSRPCRPLTHPRPLAHPRARPRRKNHTRRSSASSPRPPATRTCASPTLAGAPSGEALPRAPPRPRRSPDLRTVRARQALESACVAAQGWRSRSGAVRGTRTHSS